MEHWCVEEREIARLKAHGRGAPKKLRRQYGHCIRHWQKELRRGKRSISVEVRVRHVTLQKGGRPIRISYELPQGTAAIGCKG